MGRDRKSSLSFVGLSSKPKEDPLPPVDVHLVGLLNLGNSCFYNTILQSLSGTLPLHSIIESPPANSPALASISPYSPTYDAAVQPLSPLPISQALINILEKLEPDPNLVEKRVRPKTFNPKALLRELSRKYEDYAQATQQDAHEVLRHLIDSVMMEEVDLIKKILQQPPKHRGSLTKRRGTIRPAGAHPPPPERPEPPTSSGEMHVLTEEPEDAADDDDDEEGVADDEEEDEEEGEGGESEGGDRSEVESESSSSNSDTSDEENEEKRQKREFEKKRRRTHMRPFIDQVFGGKLASVVICEECKNVSLTREDFMDLSLSLKEDPAKLRKRDRIRKSLQAGFFSKKSSTDQSSKGSSSGTSSPVLNSSSSFIRRETTSLSEAEASTSNSEFESSNDEGPTPPPGGTRSRRNTIDPGMLREPATKPLWASTNGSNGSGSTAASRDASPLGRAFSVISSSRGGRRKKPKIPKPSAEQLDYIRKVLAEVPGPAPTPLPSQLRVAVPPGTKSDSSVSAATASLNQLKLQSSQDQQTDLYVCLQQFTAVETLDHENSFACRNCWKLLNPDLVQRRHEEKEARRRARSEKAAALANGQAEVPSPTVNGTLTATSGEGTTAKPTPVGGSPGTGPTSSPPMPMKNVPSILATSPDDATPRTSNPLAILRSSTNASATKSNPSLISSESGATTDSSTDDEASAQLADVEDDDLGGNMSDASAEIAGVADAPPRAPLTEENIQALAPKSSASLASSKTQNSSLASGAAPSGASLSTRLSEATKSSNIFRRVGAAPPRKERHILRRAHKRYLISAHDLPPVLVIHFKRFMQTSKAPLFGQSFTNLKKRDDDLTFPLELDLTPFLTPAEKPPRSTSASAKVSSSEQRRARSRTIGSSSAVSSSSPSRPMPPASYRLYAVVVHIGSLAGGHYVNYVLSNRYTEKGGKPALIKEEAEGEKEKEKEKTKTGIPENQPRRWFYCSDDEVRVCSVDEVMRSKAYMLFYEKVDKSTTIVAPKSRM
ncbi:cysteine proteinase [Meredithblackwellia eburnea MCA 4105]